VSNEQSKVVQSFIPNARCAHDTSAYYDWQESDIYDPMCLSATNDDCDSTLGMDGTACVWCDAAGGVFGLCLSSNQATMAAEYLDCDSSSGPSKNQRRSESSPMRAQSKKAALRGATAQSGVAKHLLTVAQPDPKDLQECFVLTDEKGCNADDKCSFCTAFGYGLCVTTDVSAMADGLSPLVQCDSSKDMDTLRQPLDPTCLFSVMDMTDPDEAKKTCQGTADMEGNGCFWCTFEDTYAMCLNSDQSDIAGPYLQCDNVPPLPVVKHVLGSSSQIDPNELQECLMLVDDVACSADVKCSWCSTAGYSVCVTSDIADMASGLAPLVQCGGDNPIKQQPNPDDLKECLMLTDAHNCDADEKCTFCTAFGTGVCVTTDIADMADGLAPLVQCDSKGDTPMVEKNDKVDHDNPVKQQPNPDDLKECLMLTDAEGCDADDKCTFCTAFGTGVCVTTDIADMADGLAPLVQCDSKGDVPMVEKTDKVDHDNPVKQQPNPDDLKECLTLTDAQGCDADDKCTFCTAFGTGVCVTTDIADMADGLAPLVQCDPKLSTE